MYYYTQIYKARRFISVRSHQFEIEIRSNNLQSWLRCTIMRTYINIHRYIMHYTFYRICQNQYLFSKASELIAHLGTPSELRRDFVDARAIYRRWSSAIEEQKYSMSRYEEDITCKDARGVDWPIRISINIAGRYQGFTRSSPGIAA